MSFIYMNRDLKFLRTSSIDGHTGKKHFYEWVEKTNLNLFVLTMLKQN